MPELPEVETIVRGLNEQISNMTIGKVNQVASYLYDREPAIRKIEGDCIEHFTRRGKYIIVRLKSGDSLLIHLRMTGKLLVRNRDEPLSKHDHLEITLKKSNKKLVFHDLRKFGSIQFLRDKNERKLKSLGIEATEIKPRQLHALLQKSRRQLKPFLLDQTRIAGLGNIYVDEVLHRARLHPMEITDNISYKQCCRLVRSIRTVLQQAIKKMGTTFNSYRTVSGETGGYVKYLRVYNNAGGRCRNCSGLIEKSRLAGRGTHYCPNCQKLSCESKPKR